jgi:hypothetical protein
MIPEETATNVYISDTPLLGFGQYSSHDFIDPAALVVFQSRAGQSLPSVI